MATWLVVLLCGGVWLNGPLACAKQAGEPTPTGKQHSTKSTSVAIQPRIAGLQVGFDGQFKVGYWTPFTVELVGGKEDFAGQIQLTVPDSDGILSRVHAPAKGELQLGAGEAKKILLYAKLGQIAGDVTISLTSNGEEITTRRFVAGNTGSLAGVLPSSSKLLVSVGQTNRARQNDVGRRGPRFIELASFSDLPPDWWGLEGVNVLFVNTNDADAGAQLSDASAQLAAIDLWVRMGGHLVLSVGQRGAELLADGAPLPPFAPGTFESVVPLRQSTVLETFAESTDPLSPGEPLQLKVSRLRDVQGQVEAFAGSGPRDLPLIVRRPHGFGQIVFLAFDLDQPMFDEWPARPQLLEKILGRTARAAIDESESNLGAVTTLGFTDLSGQLRAALDQFPGVRLIPFWLVAVLVTAYIACIGPLDYYLVTRVLKRPGVTWITFSGTVVLFSLGAVLMAYGLKGRELRINQLDLVDFDVESGFVRGTSWSNLFSPEIDTYDLSLLPTATKASQHGASAGVLFSWFGLTGAGFGGMDAVGSATGGMGSASQSLPLFSVAYDYSAQLDQIEGLPIAMWSSKALVGRWWQYGLPRVEANLSDDGRLVGTISNRMDVSLTQAVLLYDRWAYVIRDFEPGRTIDLAFDIDPQTADTYLRHVTAVGDRKVASPYDQTSFDVPRLVEIMTAAELAGGKAYTDLANEYDGYVELSDLVRNGRAVLLGRVTSAGTTLDRNGRPIAEEAELQNWTFHRYVFPVTEQEAP